MVRQMLPEHIGELLGGSFQVHDTLFVTPDGSDGGYTAAQSIYLHRRAGVWAGT